MKFFVAVIFLESYFIADFLISTTTLKHFIRKVDEFLYTCKSEPFYLFALNAEREYISWGLYPINQREAVEVCVENNEKVYELNNKMLEIHLKNRAIHN